VGFPDVIVLLTTVPHHVLGEKRRNYTKVPANTIYPMPVILLRVCCINGLLEFVCNADLLRGRGGSVVF